MKKRISILLTLVLAGMLVLTGCGHGSGLNEEIEAVFEEEKARVGETQDGLTPVEFNGETLYLEENPLDYIEIVEGDEDAKPEMASDSHLRFQYDTLAENHRWRIVENYGEESLVYTRDEAYYISKNKPSGENRYGYKTYSIFMHASDEKSVKPQDRVFELGDSGHYVSFDTVVETVAYLYFIDETPWIEHLPEGAEARTLAEEQLYDELMTCLKSPYGY